MNLWQIKGNEAPATGKSDYIDCWDFGRKANVVCFPRHCSVCTCRELRRPASLLTTHQLDPPIKLLVFQFRRVGLVPLLRLCLSCCLRNIWVQFKSSDSRLSVKTKHNLLRPACHTWTVNAWHCHWKPKRSWKVTEGDIKPWLKTRRMEAGATKEKKVGGLKHIAFYTCMESWAASAQLIAYCILIFSHVDLPPTWYFHLFLALHIKHSRVES